MNLFQALLNSWQPWPAWLNAWPSWRNAYNKPPWTLPFLKTNLLWSAPPKRNSLLTQSSTRPCPVSNRTSSEACYRKWSDDVSWQIARETSTGTTHHPLSTRSIWTSPPNDNDTQLSDIQFRLSGI